MFTCTKYSGFYPYSNKDNSPTKLFTWQMAGEQTEEAESRDQAEVSKPGEETDARDAEAEHVVGDGRQVSLPGGRRGEQVRIRQEKSAGKSHMDAVEQSGKDRRVSEAYIRG